MTASVIDKPVAEPVTPDPVPTEVTLATGDGQLTAAATVIVVMATIATVGFGTVFSSSGYLLVSLAGAALGALVVVLGRRANLLFGEILGLGLIAPMLVGPLVTGGTGFYQGLVRGWADILSATPPVDPTAALKALPFIAAFAGALFGTELFRIRELPGLAVVGPLATLTLTALFSEQTRNVAVGVGLVLLVGLLLLARLHYASVSTTGLLLLGLVIGVVAALALATSLALPYANEERRFDLRDLQVPPWDPLSVPSPLSDVKAGLLKAGTGEEPILRVTGETPVGRWRLASLPAYNGVFWSVAEANQTADFVSVDTFLPDIEDEKRSGDDLTFDVEVLGSVGAWLPTAGVPSRVAFGEVTDARMSLQTGTIGIPTRLRPGDTYELTVTPWVELSDTELAQVSFVADATAVELELLPPSVRNLAADFSTGIDQLSGQRVIAIRDNLRLGSYELDPPPGHTFGRIGSFLQVVQLSNGPRLESELRPLVGYEEIYTASGAILTRLSDIPARVAVGYVVPPERWNNGTAEIFASDSNAWVEVYIEDQGWMPIDVTPDRDRQPEKVDDNTETAGAPFAEPPKSPPVAEDAEPPAVEDAEDEKENEEELDDALDEEIAAGFGVATAVAGAAAAGLGVLLLIALAVVGYKVLRRGRRRSAENPASRIAGAWAELIDRVDEAGGGLPVRSTPAEAAQRARAIQVLAEPEIAARVERLADQVSASAFHPSPPTVEAAEAAWLDYDEVVASINGGTGSVGRVRRALDPRTLREDNLAEAR